MSSRKLVQNSVNIFYGNAKDSAVSWIHNPFWERENFEQVPVTNQYCKCQALEPTRGSYVTSDFVASYQPS